MDRILTKPKNSINQRLINIHRAREANCDRFTTFTYQAQQVVQPGQIVNNMSFKQQKESKTSGATDLDAETTKLVGIELATMDREALQKGKDTERLMSQEDSLNMD